jgi:PhnB protein
MSSTVKPIPDGYRTVTPYLCIRGAAKALDFYKRAFGAQVTVSMGGPGGLISHAEMKIGDSMIMLADEMPMSTGKSPESLGGTSVNLFLYLEDVDSVFNQAVAAGAKVEMPLADQFWGDRYGKLTDPFGHSWSLATHVEDVTPEDMGRRMKAAMAKMPQTAGATTGD